MKIWAANALRGIKLAKKAKTSRFWNRIFMRLYYGFWAEPLQNGVDLLQSHVRRISSAG